MIQLHKDIINLETVSSTNDFAKQLLSKQIPDSDITIVSTQEQTKGRGQIGNCWESTTGMNCTFSIIIKPHNIKPEKQFYISMITSLAMVEFLRTYIKQPVSIKWPNDIYCQNKKICGILIENTLMGEIIETSIIGIGLNVNQTTFSKAIPNPTSLAQETGKNFETEAVLHEFISIFEKWLKTLLTGTLTGILKAYKQNLYLFKTESQFCDENGPFLGKIIDIKPNGILQIEHSNTQLIREYIFKEVQYIHN
mgnify:CR=1 FL=1